MKPLRKITAGLFGFDRRERRGTYVLSVMLIILLLLRFTAFSPGRVPDDLSEIMPPDEILRAAADDADRGHTLFTFDPNTVSYDDLLRLGLPERQAGTLIKYRDAGARFRRPEDLLRVYGIDSAAAARLYPYILIESEPAGRVASGGGRRQPSRTVADEAGGSHPYDREADADGGVLPYAREAAKAGGTLPYGGTAGGADEKAKAQAKGQPTIIIDLNRCTAGDLVCLPGIGPVLSERIIRYRSLLGGFVDTRQLGEVYGLDSTVVSLIATRVTITLDSVEALLLDSASFGDLARHPYVGYEAARVITRYRRLAGAPLTLGAMVSRNVITPQQAERMAPYVRPSTGASGNDYEFISSKVLK